MNGVMIPGVSAGSNQVGATETWTAHVSRPSGAPGAGVGTSRATATRPHSARRRAAIRPGVVGRLMAWPSGRGRLRDYPRTAGEVNVRAGRLRLTASRPPPRGGPRVGAPLGGGPAGGGGGAGARRGRRGGAPGKGEHLRLAVPRLVHSREGPGVLPLGTPEALVNCVERPRRDLRRLETL